MFKIEKPEPDRFAMCPAAPGTYVLRFDPHTGGFTRFNVVAWVVSGNKGLLFPATHRDYRVITGDGNVYVLFPDGRVEGQGGTWESEAEFLASVREQADREALGT